MGSALARALLQAGYRTTVWDRKQKRQEAIQAFIINQPRNASEKRTPASPARNKKSRRRGSIHDR
jgi:3-hydroxyisobutyrate dehydrogenase-like beta-hydroxyacid dehydrogenase